MRWVLFGALLVACGGSSTGNDPGHTGGGTGGLGGDGGGGAVDASAGTGGAMGCIPNQQLACACGGSEVGYQICLPDGSGFYPCVCPDAGAGGDSSVAGGAAGASGAGGAAAGAGGAGGAAGAGGAGGVSGAAGSSGATGGTAGSGGCPSTMKYCSGVCVAPSPTVGCSLTSCAPCYAPAHSGAICNGSDCDIVCDAGYVKSGWSCVPTSGGGGTGGTGGIGGTGGTGGGSCNPQLCPTPPPPAVKCCITLNGPCGIDYQQGAGCVQPSGIDAGTCPSTKPTAGTACSLPGMGCSYGSSYCYCFGVWSCN